MQVKFRKTDVPIETRDGADIKEMDIVEFTYPDGKVVAFPADMKSPETGRRYREMYAGQYEAFKSGDPDPHRVAQLEQEIAERQAELDGMRKAPDDERVSDNLGYDHNPKAGEDPHNATKPDYEPEAWGGHTDDPWSGEGAPVQRVEQPAPVLGPVDPPDHPVDPVARDEPAETAKTT